MHIMCQTAQQAHGLYSGWIIEEGRGFIQQDERCLLCQSLGYDGLLPLTIAQRMYLSLSQMPKAHHAHGFIHHALVLCLQSAEETGIGSAPHAHQFAYRQALHINGFREHHTHEMGQMLHINLLDGLLVHQNLSAQGLLESSDGTQEGTFARAVSTQQTHHLALRQTGIQSLRHHRPSVSYFQVLQSDLHHLRYIFFFCPALCSGANHLIQRRGNTCSPTGGTEPARRADDSG